MSGLLASETAEYSLVHVQKHSAQNISVWLLLSVIVIIIIIIVIALVVIFVGLRGWRVLYCLLVVITQND